MEAQKGEASGRGQEIRFQSQKHELVLPRGQEPDTVCPQDPVHGRVIQLATATVHSGIHSQSENGGQNAHRDPHTGSIPRFQEEASPLGKFQFSLGFVTLAIKSEVWVLVSEINTRNVLLKLT